MGYWMNSVMPINSMGKDSEVEVERSYCEFERADKLSLQMENVVLTHSGD